VGHSYFHEEPLAQGLAELRHLEGRSNAGDVVQGERAEDQSAVVKAELVHRVFAANLAEGQQLRGLEGSELSVFETEGTMNVFSARVPLNY
jgi:hypothetical protein